MLICTFTRSQLIHAENLKKEIGKNNIIDQFLLDFQKHSTQSTPRSQAEVLVDHLMKHPWNITSIPLCVLKTTSQMQNLVIQKHEVPCPQKKGHIDQPQPQSQSLHPELPNTVQNNNFQCYQ